MSHFDDAYFDRVPCGLLVTDADDAIAVVNDTFLRWTGYSRDQVVGRTFASLLDHGGQAFYATQYQDELWSRQEIREIALTLTRPDGGTMPILLNAHAIRIGEQVTGAEMAIFDATARQDFEREMLSAKRAAEQSETTVRVLQEAATRFLGAHTQEDLVEQLMFTVRDAFDAADTVVSLYDGDGETFRIISGEHLQPLLSAVRASRTDGQLALLPDQLIVVPNIEDAYARHAPLGDQLRAVRAAAFIGVPISDGDNVMGTFGAVFGRPREFDEPTVELYRALARQAGLAFSRLFLQHDLEVLATRDPLTRVANRFTIDQNVSDAIDEGHRDGVPAALVFLDLDGFKAVNDIYGHHAGDQVLQVTADRIVAAVRDTDQVGRFGGDEFLVVCPRTDETAASHIAERIRTAVRQPIPGIPEDARITASIGVATYDPHDGGPKTADSLTGDADSAMYASKRAGSDRVTVSRHRD